MNKTYYIKLVGEPLYIWTEIDSSGMSAYLSRKKESGDTWIDRESAERFVKRLAEPASKFRNDQFEIVE